LPKLKISGLQARLLVLIILVVYNAIFTPYFWGVDNLTNILVNGSVVGIIACAMTLLLVARQIDISVGAAVGLSASVFVVVAESRSLWIGLAFGFLAALFVALINIVSIVYFRVESIIVTLAGLIVFRGLSKVVLDGRSVTVDGFDFIGVERLNSIG
jgi:ribose/xylose/arabinose/galactoside ABC-type transport system permease subunit